MNISAALSNESGDSRRASGKWEAHLAPQVFIRVPQSRCWCFKKAETTAFPQKKSLQRHMASLCRASSKDLLKTHIMLIHRAKKQGNGKRQFKQFNALLVLFPPNCYEWLSVLSPILECCNITDGFQKITVSKLRNSTSFHIYKMWSKWSWWDH